MFPNFLLLLLCLTITISYRVSDFKPSILKASLPSAYYPLDTGPTI
jgi:hypothetical protein